MKGYLWLNGLMILLIKPVKREQKNWRREIINVQQLLVQQLLKFTCKS